MFEKTMVNGVLSPLGEKVEPGETVQEAKKMQRLLRAVF